MGTLRVFICNSCKKEYDIAFGAGLDSITLKFVRSIYACEKCGNWEVVLLDVSKISQKERTELYEKALKDAPSLKYIIDSIADFKLEKECPNCKNIMKALPDIKIDGTSIFPKLICKECKSELSYKYSGLWD